MNLKCPIITGVGAMYGQGPDWLHCRPADFMSRKFTSAQVSYTTMEQEIIAILEALHTWEDKLIGRSSEIPNYHEEPQPTSNSMD